TRPLRRTPRMVVPLNIVTFFVYRAFLHRALRSKHRISVAKPRVANRGRAGRAVLWVVAFGPRPPDRRSQMNDAYDRAPLAPGRDTASLVESVSRTISCNCAPAPIVMSHGEGPWLYDRDGGKYLDFVAGIAVCCLGHSHPDMVTALTDQVSRLVH